MARGVSLRSFRPEDAEAVHRWFNSPAATANLLEHRDAFSEEDARGWVERAMDDSGDDRKWAVAFEGIDEPVGYTALYGLGRQTAPELGAIIGDERVAGKGVGREAERLTNSQGLRGVRRPQGLRPDPRHQRGRQEGRHLQRLAAGGRAAPPRPPRRRADRRRGLGRVPGGRSPSRPEDVSRCMPSVAS